MAELKILPPAAKYIKKLKDKQLKKLYQDAIDDILENPEIGEKKTGDLAGIWSLDIYYNRVNYELAYTIEYEEVDEGIPQMIIVIMAGTRENFYDELKKYWH